MDWLESLCIQYSYKGCGRFKTYIQSKFKTVARFFSSLFGLWIIGSLLYSISCVLIKGYKCSSIQQKVLDLSPECPFWGAGNKGGLLLHRSKGVGLFFCHSLVIFSDFKGCYCVIIDHFTSSYTDLNLPN